jgi:hypothetical protein
LECALNDARAEVASQQAVIERRLTAEDERKAAQRDLDQSQLVASLQAELALAVTDQRRLQALVSRAGIDQRRLIAAHASARAQAEGALGAATLANHQIVKTLADQRVELDQWRTLVGELEPVASAGRLAIQLARELHQVMLSLENRAGFLLGVSPLDASCRPEMESLRADAIRASSLARQLARPHADAPPARETV